MDTATPSPESHHLLRALPRIDAVIESLCAQFPAAQRATLQNAARQAVEMERAAILSGINGLSADALCDQVLHRACLLVENAAGTSPRRVLNGTGIVVHTGLGRSLLSKAAIAAIARVAESHCALEVDIETGERGRRDAVIAGLLRQITGCEDATVCNNNAGATLLALNTLAAGREAICARGELVEIGGGFRMPEVMAQSAALLREVGCTNKTRLSDYAAAINLETGALLKVHTSNYRIVGFTESVALKELVTLGQERGLPVIEDIGSGVLVDLSRAGLRSEPQVQDSIAAGADIVCFSGDKLLGGPQCGILCGKREAIERVRRNSLMRALRVDKFTLAALEATLRHYRDESEAWREIPTLTALAMPPEQVKARARKLLRLLQKHSLPLALQVVPSEAQAGAGALPAEIISSFALALHPHSMPVDELARRLRLGDPSVWGRIRDDALLLDCRTLREEELSETVQSVRKAVT